MAPAGRPRRRLSSTRSGSAAGRKAAVSTLLGIRRIRAGIPGIAIRTTEQNEQESTEVRYFILSRYVSGRGFASAVRGHWGIENQLHWQLDVTFGEDKLRIRKDHAPTNMSIAMRTSLSLLKNETSNRRGLKTKRLAAGWDEAYLEKVLTGA